MESVTRLVFYSFSCKAPHTCFLLSLAGFFKRDKLKKASIDIDWIAGASWLIPEKRGSSFDVCRQASERSVAGADDFILLCDPMLLLELYLGNILSRYKQKNTHADWKQVDCTVPQKRGCVGITEMVSFLSSLKVSWQGHKSSVFTVIYLFLISCESFLQNKVIGPRSKKKRGTQRLHKDYKTNTIYSMWSAEGQANACNFNLCFTCCLDLNGFLCRGLG